MCLAVPMKVMTISGPVAEVEDRGVRRAVRVDLIDAVAVGDYVIVHAGIAIEKLDQVEAEETLRLLEQMLSAPERPAGP